MDCHLNSMRSLLNLSLVYWVKQFLAMLIPTFCAANVQNSLVREKALKFPNRLTQLLR